jgi:hypothetical protein
MAVGFVVLIGLAIALGCLMLIVGGGVVAERIRRKQQGYEPAPTWSDKSTTMGRVPPEDLFSSLAHAKDAPTI